MSYIKLRFDDKGNELPEVTNDLYIDGILQSSCQCMSGEHLHNLISICLNERPKVRAIDGYHKFVIESYLNNTKLREFLVRTLEFEGSIIGYKKTGTNTSTMYEVKVKIKDNQIRHIV